jgi:hypothetical protein
MFLVPTSFLSASLLRRISFIFLFFEQPFSVLLVSPSKTPGISQTLPQQVVPRLIATANSTVNCIYHPSTVFPSLFKVIFLLSIEQLYLRHEFKPAQISSSYLALR